VKYLTFRISGVVDCKATAVTDAVRTAEQRSAESKTSFAVLIIKAYHPPSSDKMDCHQFCRNRISPNLIPNISLPKTEVQLKPVTNPLLLILVTLLTPLFYGFFADVYGCEPRGMKA
jgi:hypothetical protein